MPNNGGIDNLEYCKDCSAHPLVVDRLKRSCKAEEAHKDMWKSIKNRVPWFVFIPLVVLMMGFVTWNSDKHFDTAEARHAEIERLRKETNDNIYIITRDIAVIKNELEK